MKVTFEGSSKEIAALVSAVQERQYAIEEQGKALNNLKKEVLGLEMYRLEERAAVMHKWKPKS